MGGETPYSRQSENRLAPSPMPKPLDYWEDLLEKLLQERGSSHDYDLSSWSRKPIPKPPIWVKQSGRWVRARRRKHRWQEALTEDAWRRMVIRRRHSRYVAQKLNKRIAYCQERIKSFKTPRTAWEHILLGLKRAAREERGQ